MTWWGLRLRQSSVWRVLAVVTLALLVADCARRSQRAEDTRQPAAAARASAPGAPGAATLVPPDLALAFLQEIKSDSGSNPPCKFTEKGTWSAGEYRKITLQKAATQITGYPQWILFKIEDSSGRDFAPADLGGSGAWVYSLRTPRTARTSFGTTDQCSVGPTSEPTKKMIEALTALGVGLAAEYGYIPASR